jgi:hypothetical protein
MIFAEIVNAWLKSLSLYLNHPLVQLDENSRASIQIGHCKIVFSPSECGQYLLSQSPIVELPTDQRRSGILRALASSNYSSSGEGGILGLEKATGLIWLTYRFNVNREKPESFLKTMAIQTGLVEYWLKIIANAQKEDSPQV